MPVVEQNVYTAIASLCSGRVFPQRIPEGTTRPCISYLIMPTSPEVMQDGYVRQTVWRLNVWADSYDDMVNTAQSVLALLGSSATYHSSLRAEMDMPDADTGLYRRVLEFTVGGN